MPAKTATERRDTDRLTREYRRLLSLFSVEITSFERKRYLNLSHRSNKAANLNSYIGLLGRPWRERRTQAGVLITTCSPENADFTVPAADFILVLDADTIISPDYTSRLVCLMCRPENGTFAVAQCPYSTFPGAPLTLQRIAGAQTDIQYLLHQGLTYYDATYWVGANAVVRTAALKSIMTIEKERGFKIYKFIQDRTVIEDTESSIDLICHGWKLFNYPHRLAFSATPPDFGSLIVQRRRWANGGLLILPKLLRYWRSIGTTPATIAEIFMRAQYLLSLGPVSIALLFVILFSLGGTIWANWMIVTALFYYTFYLRDLHLNGYGWFDLFRVFALNMLLVPVNIAGFCLSIYQACSGYKAQFGRTPKTAGRTPTPGGYVLGEFTILLTLFFLSVLQFQIGNRLHAGFILAHAVALLYAIKVFLGFRHAFRDVAALGTSRPHGALAGRNKLAELSSTDTFKLTGSDS
jgi:hypothetical protein